MEFVQLHRCFVPIGKDQEPNLDLGLIWGRKIGGWLEWSDLLEHRRVVVLAEASSGKTKEFCCQAATLLTQGKPAFFLPIEELADGAFEAALDPHADTAFTSWLTGNSVGWFFLDSVDEARLNRKSFESALRRFARKLDRALERARVLISCRMSDWKGDEDRRAIEQHLPVWEAPEPPPADDEHRALLTPIFKSSQDRTSQPSQEPVRKRNELLVVQLVPLSAEQRHALATASGLQDVDHFIAAIDRHGLDVLAERPGDLLELARYWKSYSCFDTLARMTDHGITVKLSEPDKYRPDNDTLSLQKAREGAERVAAALTLSKSLTLRTPGDDPDPSLAAGALDPVMILDDWTDAERNALMRRGIFVPSTYGRVRFHHRSTQEYLTAQWFERLLHAGCPKSEIWHLFFAARYGVETVVLPLRPAAAWLAMHYPELRDEIIRREPLVLLRYGDPGSLPLDTRKRLLRLYAEKHARGEIADDSLDHRLLWMFADEGLTDAIHEAWNINERTDFRIDLLKLIGAGAITDCIDLARAVAHNERAEDYMRIAALRALNQCRDQEGLDHAAKQLMANPAHVSARVAASFAKLLYPCSLTTDALLTLIAESPPAQQFTVEGFPYAITELYVACPDAAARSQFLSGLAELCLMPPFADDYQRVSLRYKNLTQHLFRIVRRSLQELVDHDPPEYLVRLLMAVERAEYRPSIEDGPELDELVRANAKLNRALFWADVEEVREHSTRDGLPSRYQSVFFGGTQLWHLELKDIPWLFEDMATRPRIADQQMALSAIVSILRLSNQLATELDRLRALVANRPSLPEDLEAYLGPPQQGEEIGRLEREHTQRRDEATQQAKASWIRFREGLRSDPSQLYNPGHLATPASVIDLGNLTQWLIHRTQAHDHARAALQWRLLEEGFGQAIAEAYRKGMQALWRITRPERPKRNPDGSVTVKWKTIFSCAGVAIEAAEDPGWTAHLSASEATLAAQHGCMTEQGYPEWIDALVATHPQMVVPVLRQTLAKEWASSGPSDFLYHYANLIRPIPCAVQQLLFKIIVGAEPHDLGRLDTGLEILHRLDLNGKDRHWIARLARRRLRRYAEAGQNNHVLHYLAFLLLVDPNRALDDLTAWLDAPQAAERSSTAELTFGVLFGQHGSLAATFLNNASVSGLESLLLRVYRHIRPADDVPHEGTYTPNARDRAEDARNAIFKALLDKPGEDAYRAMLRLSEDEHFSLRAMRLRELARGKAERDAEPPSWNTAEVLNLERHSIAAVKTGTDLLRVVLAILDDITHDFFNADASSQRVLETAEDEDAVQKWLAEQLTLRAPGRFHVHREAEVAWSKEPDIIVSSTAAPCQVAIEVKHANMEWTVREFDKALRKQLAGDYLRPTSRQHGVFVITLHKKRTWRHPETNITMSFKVLMNYLSEIASTLVMNATGHPIEVRVMGIDASTDI